MGFFDEKQALQQLRSNPAPQPGGGGFRPSQLVSSISNIGSEQAQQISQDVMNMVKGNLASYKEMGGKKPWDKMETMAYTQNDNNIALDKLKTAAALSGKIPDMDTLTDLGLTHSFGDLAGQTTYGAEQDAIANALARSKAASGSKPTQTQINNANLGAAYEDVRNAINSGAKKDEIIKNITYNADQYKGEYGVDYKDLLGYLDKIYDPNLYYAETHPQEEDPGFFKGALAKIKSLL